MVQRVGANGVTRSRVRYGSASAMFLTSASGFGGAEAFCDAYQLRVTSPLLQAILFWPLSTQSASWSTLWSRRHRHLELAWKRRRPPTEWGWSSSGESWYVLLAPSTTACPEAGCQSLCSHARAAGPTQEEDCRALHLNPPRGIGSVLLANGCVGTSLL